jgi:hypothetical protein
MTENNERFGSYRAFWPFYLSQHSQRSSRLFHVCGTFLAVLALIEAVVCFSLFWLILVPIIGYGFAWFAHAFIEKNKPATFTYPLWSLMGDGHMLWYWLTGKLEIELIRHHIFS